MSDGRRDMTAPSRAQLERSLSVAESRLDALTAERHELANAIADHWRPRVTSLEETNRSLRQRLEAFEARALDLVNQLNDANSDEAQQIAQLTADLATERAAREKAEHYNAAGDVALFKMQSERDAALARVTHLQSEIRAHRQAHQETSRECEAAESALASVREWADRFERDVPKAELMRRLSSAPSPARCSVGNCADCNRVPCQCKVPAAPCSGCEELKAKLERARTELDCFGEFGNREYVTRALEALR